MTEIPNTSTKLADHITVTAHPDQPLVCVNVRNAEVTMSPDEWAKVSVAGDLAAMRVRLRGES
jgi:nitrate reductase alpha subunit